MIVVPVKIRAWTRISYYSWMEEHDKNKPYDFFPIYFLEIFFFVHIEKVPYLICAVVN